MISLSLINISDVQKFWKWPMSHFDMEKRTEIETTLLCFAHSQHLCHVPEEIVTLIINLWGCALKIMMTNHINNN